MRMLSADLSPPCMRNPDLAKIKIRIEKNFPDFGDLTKVQGYDMLRQICHNVVGELNFFNDLILDICEFRRAAKELLREIPQSLVHFKLDMHRGIIILYFDLMLAYMKVMLIFSSIEERKAIGSMYSAAYHCAKEENEPNLGELAKLLTDSDGIQRIFIDEFSPHSEFIGASILQFFESIMVNDSCENLRSKYVLNPTFDGDNMSGPSKMKLNSKSDCHLSMYTELREASTYSDYIVYAFLACPGLIFDPDGKYNEIFKLVISDHLVVNVFRDTTLNLHAELESLYSSYPSKRDNVTVPKGFKVKNIIKEFARVAVQSVGMRHQERRSFIHAEVKNLRHLLTAVPGLLGPKFPVVLAAASMAKSELLHYFRHLSMDARKDVKKYMNGDHYKCRDITTLMDDLHELTCLVEKHREIVEVYYAEYLSGWDADTVAPLCANAVSVLPENSNEQITALLMSIPHDLRTVDPEELSNSDLSGLRLNWSRYTTILATSSKFSREANDELAYLMQEVVEHSRYVDDLPELIKEYFVPHELWWFQSRLVDCFREGLEGTYRPMSVFGIVSAVPMSLHDDCPEEGLLLSESAWRLCDLLVSLTNKYVESMLGSLWDHFISLEKKSRASDAGQRLERQWHKQNQAKDGSKPSSQQADHYPGFESEGWAKKSIAPLAHNRRSLVAIMEQAHSLGNVLVFNKEYNIEVAIRQFMSSYFENRIKSVVVPKGDMERPSLVLMEIAVGCRTMQAIYEYISADMPRLLRAVLFRNFCDTTVPPPGAATILRQAPPKESPTGERPVVWQIATWFCMLVQQASASESGLMWIPSTKSFARAKTSLRPIDVYINRDEMAALCMFIGVQGVRCIDSMLLSIIAERVHTTRDFISENQTVLISFNRHRYKSSILSQLKMTEAFLTASVTVGVALALREALHQGMSDALQILAPFLRDSLGTLTSAVKPFILQDVTTPLYSIAFDAGVMTEADLSLAQAIRPLVSSAEDKKIFTLLPVAYAACFMSPYWQANGQYLPAFEAFKGNQHTLALTISKFFLCFIESSSGEGEGRPASLPRRRMTITDGGSTYASSLREAADTFLELSANVILSMRINEAEFSDRHLRPMSNILEAFIRNFPLMDRHCLEKYFPYAHIHASQMDIAMGRIKGTDSLTQGMQMIMNASSTGAATVEG